MKLLVILLVCLVLSIPMSGSDKPDGKAMIEAAEAKMNIFELPSFEIQAAVLVRDKDKTYEGSYELLWYGAQQWREMLTLPGYSEVHYGGKGVVFHHRNVDFLPLPAYQVYQTLGYGSFVQGSGAAGNHFFHCGPQDDEVAKKVRDTNQNGQKLTCIEITGKWNTHRNVCIDQATGAIMRGAPYADKDLGPVGPKLFPRFLSLHEGKTLVEIRITRLETPGAAKDLSSLEPPAGMENDSGCMNPLPFHLVKRVAPQYPDKERGAGIQGAVSIHARIGANLKQSQIVSGVTPGLNQASMQAVEQWAWEPAQCAGKPVDTETIITVNYSLQN